MTVHLAGIMKFLTALILILLPVSAQAQDGLPEPLQALLAAAAFQEESAQFETAVTLMALTQTPEAIVSAAESLSADYAVRARAVLGVDDAVDEVLENDAVSTEEISWRDMPVRAIETLANGKSELWSGQVRGGFRQDSGNSDQLDYTLALSVQRDLSVWGFQGNVDYGYSEIGGSVGRDALSALAQLDREVGDRWTVFTGIRYEQDALSGFDWTTLIDAGFGYRILTGEERTWRVQAGPAVRFVEPVNDDMRTEAAGEFSSDFDWHLSETLLFSADSQILLTGQSRFEQVLAVQTRLGELWALQLAHRYRNEFDPEPGFDDEDTRTDISVVREF